MVNLSKPKEKIYLLLYNKPLNVGKISDDLYGERNTKVSQLISELLNDGWIEEIKNKERAGWIETALVNHTISGLEALVSNDEGLYRDYRNRIEEGCILHSHACSPCLARICLQQQSHYSQGVRQLIALILDSYEVI